jgi:hypothetical protein
VHELLLQHEVTIVLPGAAPRAFRKMPRPAQPRPRSRRRLLLAGAPLLAAGAVVSVVLVGSAGRNGVAVTRVFDGERTEWISSRSTRALREVDDLAEFR